MAQTPPSSATEQPKIQTFIHVIGCRGAQELFIFLKGEGGVTRVAHFTEANYPSEEQLKAVLQGVHGYERKFECGASA